MSSDGRLKRWLKKKLGIPSLDYRLQRLEELEHFTLANIVDKLSESMIILAGNNQTLENVNITVPLDKSGVLVLGDNTLIRGSKVEATPYRIVKEPL